MLELIFNHFNYGHLSLDVLDEFGLHFKAHLVTVDSEHLLGMVHLLDTRYIVTVSLVEDLRLRHVLAG